MLINGILTVCLALTGIFFSPIFFLFAFVHLLFFLWEVNDFIDERSTNVIKNTTET